MMGAGATPSPLWGGSIREAERGGGGGTSAAAEIRSTSFSPPPRLDRFALQSSLADPPRKGEGEAARWAALPTTALAIFLATASIAHAACPMALAVYGERDEVAGVDFRPNGASAAATNTFKMWVGDGVLLDGIVMWTDDPARSVGMLMHKCPEGDVTGEELAACTLWQGVVYTADAQGNIGLVPKHDEAAPERLIFTDLGPALKQSAIFGTTGFTKAPWDVFQLKGCQE